MTVLQNSPGHQQADAVGVFTLGGTIAMSHNGADPGVSPSLTASDLVSAVPGLEDLNTGLEVHDVRCLPGSSLTFADVDAVLQAIHRRLDEGAITGAVVTQGTDTIEETAWLLDLLHDRDSPIVVTGAMRHPSMAGADGPANLLSAVQVAASPAARGLGVLVVFADGVHAARRVRKTHSTSVTAFASSNTGPIGQVNEGTVRIWDRAPRPPKFFTEYPNLDERLDSPRIVVLPAVLGQDDAVLRAVGPLCDGLVVAGCGVGHVPAGWVPALEEIAGRVPVVLASRTGAGPVASKTYGFAGSETDLLGRGLISAGYLDAYKARVLLQVAVAAGLKPDRIRETFDELAAY